MKSRDHDWIENSHASTVLSYAHGLAVAQESELGEGRRVIAVIGDGSMTGGMAFEGLNNFGHCGRNAIIILNDNGRSYAPTISRLGESLARLRLNPTWLRQQARIERTVQRLPAGERHRPGPRGHQGRRPRDVGAARLLRAAGRPLHGPLRRPRHRRARAGAAQRRRARTAPVVIHVLTQKGKGHAAAEQDIRSSASTTSAAVKPGSYTAAFTEVLLKEADEQPEIVAITAAMPDSTGLLPFADRFPDRCFDVGIAEQHAVTSAAGMAMGGLRPVVAVYSTFLSRAFDQINLDVGLHRLPVIFCVDRAGVTGDDGPSHHGVLDMVLFTKVPDMVVFAPSSYQELQVMFHDALELHVGPARHSLAEDDGPPGVGPTRSATVSTAAAFGARPVHHRRRQIWSKRPRPPAARGDGVSVTVWDARVVKPFDPDMLADATAHPYVITVEDGLKDGGVGIRLRRRAPRRSDGGGASRGPRRARPLPPPRQAGRDPGRAGPRRRGCRHVRSRPALFPPPPDPRSAAFSGRALDG